MVTKFLNIDTDNTLSANSNERVPSQKAVKTYTDNLTTAKQNKVLDTPITVGSTEETTVEGALGAINTSLSNKQNQSLSSAITVDGTQQTTVEGALNAINIVAGSAIQPSDLATVATTGSYNDLLDKPTIPAGQVQSNWDESDESDVSYIQNKPILGTMATENAADYTKTANLANVALSGDYDDLTNKPTIPAAQVQSDWDESDESDVAYIKNKPYIPSEVIVDQTYDSTSTHAQSGTAVAQAISTKQDTLTAGNNITISSNVISAKDTTYIAGTGISITEDSDENLVISNTQTSAEWGNITGTLSNQTDLQTALSDKQDTLVSGTNIKTVNNNSLLGSGNLDIDSLPSQSGQSGKFLTTDGTSASWGNVPATISGDGITIIEDSDELTTIAVKDQNTSAANKFWTGTKAEYDSIVTKDPDTEYTTTDENETVYQNSYRIGQVLPSILPISDYGLHLLDGAVIDGTGIYSSFYSYIAGFVSTYPNLFISEADWQTAVNTYGVCGKFVYDSTNQTIRLPKITGIIEGTTDVTALGDLVQAGLPNITGGMSPTGLAGVSASYGAFYNEASNTTDYQCGTREGYGVRWGFNAARSSAIYGNSNTVQPQTIKVYYYIVIANSYQTPTGVQISKVATDLNGKVNLNSSWGMPSNNYADLSAVSGQYYTASADGCFVLWGTNTNANSSSWISLTIFPAQNDNTIGKQVSWTPQVGAGNVLGATISCKKGDRCYVAFYNTTVTRLRFIYAQKDNN